MATLLLKWPGVNPQGQEQGKHGEDVGVAEKKANTGN